MEDICWHPIIYSLVRHATQHKNEEVDGCLEGGQHDCFYDQLTIFTSGQSAINYQLSKQTIR